MYFIIDNQVFVVLRVINFQKYFVINVISFIFAVAILIKGCGAGVFNFEG